MRLEDWIGSSSDNNPCTELSPDQLNQNAVNNSQASNMGSSAIVDPSTMAQINTVWNSQGGINSVGHPPNCPCVNCSNLNINGHHIPCFCPSCQVLPVGIGGLPWAPSQPYWTPIPLSSPSVLQGIRTLTDDERKELADIRIQRMQETKQVKLDAFKKLPPDFRQRIIDSITWDQKSFEISRLEADKCDREKELEGLFDPPGMFVRPFGTLSGFMPANDSGQYSQRRTPIPDGLTADDLMKAHNDACMEEAIERNDDEQVQVNTPGT